MCSGGPRSSVEGITRRPMEMTVTPTVRCACWIIGIAVATLLVPTPAAAVTNRPAREDTNQSPIVIQRVEVPVAVPVDDTTNEATQMAVAAALGAAVAACARRPRSRRRRTRTGTGIIDITDAVGL